ncbi:MAG: hypothetical protein NVS3B26_14940 [Mycobacteriales bacterium]
MLPGPQASPDGLGDVSPFDRPDFRSDVARLAEAVRTDWQRYAEQAVLTAQLAKQVPRAPFDDGRAPSEWKSFLREVAVARRCSDQTAGKEVYLAVALARSHPRTLELLQAGQMPEFNAKVLVGECAGCDPLVADTVEEQLADRACALTPARIRDEVRKIELRLDADAAAARAAKAVSARGISFHAGRDDQATLVMSGPVLPVAQFFEAVTAAARAARAAGDQRGLDALKFDLAVGLPDAVAPSGPDVTDAVNHGPTAATRPEPARTAAAIAGHPAAVVCSEWFLDRRRVRPVQVLLQLPVTTALGLDNEPGWLPGYGWVSAPQCRQWLTIAELRQVCVDAGGFVVDSADRVVRPAPTPSGVREAVLAMVRDPGEVTDKTCGPRTGTIRAPCCAASSTSVTCSATARPAPEFRHPAAITITRSPTRSGRPQRGTSKHARIAPISSNTAAGCRCARRRRRCGSPQQDRSLRYRTTPARRPTSMSTPSYPTRICSHTSTASCFDRLARTISHRGTNLLRSKCTPVPTSVRARRPVR